MSNIIDSIRMSGTTYAISDSGGTKVVEITQSDYDNLPTSAKTANIMYVITDAEPFDVSNYYTKAETSGATELATAFAATQPKLSAGTNITIDANNVISAGGGGGKAIVGGRGITVTSGETADTVSFNLPISAGTGTGSLIIGDNNGGTSYASVASGRGAVVFPSRRFYGKNYATEESSFAHGSGCSAGTCSHAEGFNTKCMNGFNSHSEGQNTEARGNNSHSEGENTLAGQSYTIYDCHAEGYRTSAMTSYSHAEGYCTKTTNESEHSQGRYNVSNKANGTWGDSGNTLFSVGNGTANNARHNAFEIRQNGDIYITSGSTDILLQDHLGGGGGGIDSGTVQTMIDQSISGKTNQTDFVSHSGNTTMHVTESEKTTWNNKSDFSGNYNDLSNKPTIPTSASQLTNDSGYITSSALDGYATEAYVTAATNDMATKTWVGQQGYLTQHQDISGKQDVSGMTAYTTTATTNTLSGTVTAHTADTTIHVTSAEKATWNAKSDFSGDYNDLSNKLSAGTNITIVDNVISAEGGSDINVVQTTGTSTADVMSQSAVTNAFNEYTVRKDSDNGIVRFWTWKSPNYPYGQNSISNFAINGKCPLSKENGVNSSIWQFNLVETSAITTSVTSSSTDAQVPSAKAVYDQLGGLKLVKLSQSEYDSLATKDNSTLYVIVN